MNFLIKNDSYGKGFTFQIPGYGVNKTALGGVLTILYWLGTLACAIYFGKEIVLKEKPSFIKETIVLDQEPYIDLKDTLTNFTVYFKLIDTAYRNYYLKF